MNRSPLLIRLMLACHVSPGHPEKHMGETWGSAVTNDALRWLYDNGLIDADNRSTEKGKAWVGHIVNTPIPIATWSLPPREDIPIHPEAGNGLARLEDRT